MGLYAMEAIERNDTIGRHAMEVLDRLRREHGDKYPGWEEITLSAWRDEADSIIRSSLETEERTMANLRRPLTVEKHQNIVGYIEFLRQLRRDARAWIEEIDAEQRRLDEEAEEALRIREEQRLFQAVFGESHGVKNARKKKRQK